MNKLLLNTYRVFVPKPLRTIIVRKFLHKKILKYFAALPESDINDEQREVLAYLKNNPLSVFPIPFNISTIRKMLRFMKIKPTDFIMFSSIPKDSISRRNGL